MAPPLMYIKNLAEAKKAWSLHVTTKCVKILYLSRKTLTSELVRSKTLIHKVHTISDRDNRQGSDKDKET